MDKITVKYGKLKKTIDLLDKINPTDDTDVSFEYIVGSLFPDIYHQIDQRIKLAHAQGYVEGLDAQGVEFIHYKKD